MPRSGAKADSELKLGRVYQLGLFLQGKTAARQGNAMNKKKLTGFLAALAGIAAAIVATKQPRPSEPWPTPAILAEWDGTCRAVVHERATRDITDDELAACMAKARVGAQGSDLRAWADALPKPPAPPEPEQVRLAPITATGQIFRVNGEPWRWKGVSAFQLLDRFAKGEDIQPFLDAYQGYNLLRVWPYVPAKDWGAKAWDSPSPDIVVAFLTRVEAAGFYVELTLLTDDEPRRVDEARRLVDALVAARPPNVVLEIGNEPQVHKDINTRALKAALDASGFLYASGDSSAIAFGSYITAHTARDSEWPRRAHDLLELWNGGGPDAPTDPPHKIPAVADEPIRPDQAGANAGDFRAYFAACALLGAGATFHCETCKYALLPTVDEARMAAAALEGLNAFPADAPLGAYRRPVESSLRTYVVGPYMVRIRPTTASAPEGGWAAIDTDGILWRRP